MTTGTTTAIEVSVVVMTYNHARFIRQALDSVLAQRTDFRYEVLISEDCSTDGTRETVVDYQRRYPDRIEVLLSARNLRSNAVVRRGIEAARGAYVAFLDGDDYWTDPHKLRKQVEFLRAHPHCSMCFHNARVVHEDGTREERNWTPANQRPFAGLEDIWMGNFIPMCSTMFRRAALERIPAWYESMFPITDWPLHILSARHGAIGYLDEVLGVYRQHGGGLYSSQSETQKQESTLGFYRTMNANFDYRYDKLVRAALSTYFFEWAEEYKRRGDFAHARRCLRICFEGGLFSRHVPTVRLLRTAARLCLPKPKVRTGERA